MIAPARRRANAPRSVPSARSTGTTSSVASKPLSRPKSAFDARGSAAPALGVASGPHARPKSTFDARGSAAPGAPSESGQAAVELVGFMPLVALVALAAFTAVAAFSAREQAGAAAEAGAVALIQGGDAEDAARAALPAAARPRSAIRLAGRRVTVAVRPRVPLLASRLEARVTADAGPEPSP